MSIYRLAKLWLPPILQDAARSLLRRTQAQAAGSVMEWEWSPLGAQAWNGLKGWNDPSIAQVQQAKWPALVAALEGTGPVGIAHEGNVHDAQNVSLHNTLMTFGYVLARAAQGKRDISLLDWGGGAGQYYLFARALHPELVIDYHCKDLSILCDLGRKLLPQGHFTHDANAALSRRYDLVFASGAAHYERDFYPLLSAMAQAANPWLYVTRLPVIEEHDDFPVIQRPYAYGYNTEYACWFVNRRRFIAYMESQGLRLERETLLDERPYVPNAPEQCRYAGFLFRRT